MVEPENIQFSFHAVFYTVKLRVYGALNGGTANWDCGRNTEV